MKLSDFENLINDDDIRQVLNDVTKEFVETATTQLEKQQNYDGSGHLDPDSDYTLKIKAERGWDLRTGIAEKFYLISPRTYKIKTTKNKLKHGLKHNSKIYMTGKRLEHMQTLQKWGEAQGKNYMGWYEEVDWEQISKDMTDDFVEIIRKKLEKRLL
jgi:hypothetical protein